MRGAVTLSEYVELMKVRIDALLLLVAAAGYIATSGTKIEPLSFGLLMLTGFMASAGASAVNHYIDRDLDAVMHRTRARPLPAHRIEPPGRALAFGLALTGVSLGVSALWINPRAFEPDLQRKVGARIAELLDVPAAMVTAGAFGRRRESLPTALP